MNVEVLAIARNDAGGFLPTMLQGIEPQIGEVGRFLMAVNTEDGAFVVKLVGSNQIEAGVIRRGRRHDGKFFCGSLIHAFTFHAWFSVRSIEKAHCSNS